MPSAAVVERMVLAMPQVRERCDELAAEVERECVDLAHKRAFDSGGYAAGIRRQLTPGPGALVAATDKVSRWTEVGTGVFGPQHKPIVPVHGKFLVFRVREPGSSIRAGMSGQVKESGLIFARSVKGKPGQHCMRDGSRTVAERHGLRWVDNLGDGSGLR